MSPPAPSSSRRPAQAPRAARRRRAHLEVPWRVEAVVAKPPNPTGRVGGLRGGRREAPQPDRSVALATTVDPAWPAIRYPDEGVTPAEFADLIGDMVDAGSREHYVDAALYDYEYRRRRADVSFYRELARRRGAERVLELGAGSGRVTVPLARDGRQIV